MLQPRLARLLATVFLLLLVTGPDLGHSQTTPFSLAQAPPPPLPLPPGPPQPPEEPEPKPPPTLAPSPPPAKEKQLEPESSRRISVRDIQITGSTVFSSDELATVTAPYTHRDLSLGDLEELRQALTRYYIQHGYITSGATIPDQTIGDGIITIRITEGKLSRIEVEGTKWFRPSYIQNRIAVAAGPPLNVTALQEQLQLLQTDPRIRRLEAKLARGPRAGENVLHVSITEASPFKSWIEFNNFQSPVVGAEQGLITAAHQNVLGFGDTLSLQYGRSLGVNPILNFRYALPISPRNTTLAVQYRRFDFAVVEDPFEALEIENVAEIFSVGIRHPVYRTPYQEFALGLTAEHLTNKTFQQGAPSPIVPGATNGVFRISAVRFSQEWTRRDGSQVFSAFSRFSLGIGALGATTHGDPSLADGRFFAWLGVGQWVQQIQPWRIQLLTRGTLQLSKDHLFPLEQIAVGGRYSVRGYREFTVIRDNAFFTTFETRIPVFTSVSGRDIVFLAPFVDLGHAWHTTVDTPDPQTLSSVGIGLLWNIRQGSHFEVYWGHRMKKVSSPNGNLQDHGVHLQVVIELF